MIYTLFWKKQKDCNVVEQMYPEFIKKDTDAQISWINCGSFKSAMTMYRDIWIQRIEKQGYSAPVDDLRVMANVPDFWSESPRPRNKYLLMGKKK